MGISGALGAWNTSRADRLDRLAARRHTVISGEEPPEDPDFVGLLYAALAAEFQGYARDLHDECAETVLQVASHLPNEILAIISNAATDNRGLDNRDATTQTIRQDFRIFGLSIWEWVQQAHGKPYVKWRAALDEVNTIRNAAVHSDTDHLASAIHEGLVTERHWQENRRMLTELAVAMNDAKDAYLNRFTIHHERKGQDR